MSDPIKDAQQVARASEGTVFKIFINTRASDGDKARYYFVKAHDGTWDVINYGLPIHSARGGHAYTSATIASLLQSGYWTLEEVYKIPTEPSPLGFSFLDPIDDERSAFERVIALQRRGVRVLFDVDMTINIRGTDRAGTTVGFLGMSSTPEKLEAVLSRAENVFGKD